MDTLDLSNFESVLERFKHGLRNNRDRERFKATTLNELRGSIAKIQTQQHADRQLQDLKRLALFLEATKQFGEVVHLFCKSSQIMPFIWGPMRTLLEITSSSRACDKAFDELVGLYEKIGEALPLLRQYEGFFLWERLFDINWKTIKAGLLSIISSIIRHRDVIQNQSNQSQMTDSEETHTEPIFESDPFGGENNRPKRLAVCHWLRPIDPAADQDLFSKVRAEYQGTGRWLLDNEDFKEWFNPRYARIPPLLWLTGLPGSGKTIITSLIVEEVQNLSPRPRVLFFYCKQSVPEHNTFIAIARSFILQLLNQDKSLLLYLHRKHCDSNEAVLSSIPLAQEILNFLLSSCQNAYIIIDGLDECEREERKVITQWFRQVVESLPKNAPDRLRCLLVSQDDRIGVKDLQGVAKITIEPKDNYQDVLVYSRVQAEELRRKFEFSEEESSRIAVDVAGSVKGIFLLARLIWINLIAQITLAEVEEQMKEFPPEINEAYERIMDRIIHKAPQQTGTGALQLLGWLVCAKRPLKWHEIQSLKSINLDQQLVDFARHKFSVSGKDLCGSLVELREDGTLELIHVSAKMFLIDNPRYIDLVAKELELACICIDYLNLPAFTCQPTAERVLNGDYGFMDYAVLNWIRHLEAGTLYLGAHEDKIGELSESLETFIRNHWREPATRILPSDGTKKRLECFKFLGFYSQLEQSVASFKKQLRLLTGIKSREVALDLGDLILNVRKVLEDIVTSNSDPSTQKKIEDKYGAMVFKCPRLTCQFFTIGFLTKKERNEHLDKHTRPFRCIDEGCRGAIFGFSSMWERDKHIRDIHPEGTSHDQEFPTDEDVERSIRNDTVTVEATAALDEAPPPLPEPEPLPELDSDSELEVLEPELEVQRQHRSSKKGKPQQFKCPHCPKEYIKKFNFTSHLQSHTDERPFRCSQCTKAFARRSDLTRHEETHQGKQHVCRGVLRNGATWGCGKAFARADTLKTHHESEAGQRCILPFAQQNDK
ncbi:zinc finger C2H2-type integrase DNA-binding protein [Fusarium pseudocircinatum]|uniref:Zinc finger C2H2-type integrase DNA-binding protein n=1 Tax=Fusarium pseudocircinatum TaxID=56676 RepID=A0A8H5LGC5_9HYPO|nr:zinc finger C2H2-type integrase DNA-binding protein [Fusarium pseudocircinatum]